MLKYTIIAPEISSNVDKLTSTTNLLSEEIHKQEQRHYEYVNSNELHIAEIEQQLEKTSESIQELREEVRKNNICIKILCVGLLLAGISLLALIYHVLQCS